MKNLAVLAIAFVSLSAQAEVKPNQTCQGINQYNDVVKTKLFVGGKINKDYSSAKLVITSKEAVKEEVGTITNKADLIGTRMFMNNADDLRYLTSGMLYDSNYYEYRVNNMKCSKFTP